jgi:hypothetical protein
MERKGKRKMTTQTLDDYTAILTTACECSFYNDETDELEESGECFGDCYEENKDWSLETISQWIERNGKPEGAMIEGADMTWLKRSGYKLERNTDPEKLSAQILNALMLNGDFTITLKLAGKNLTARRASHDEPMGANFTITPALVCQGWRECEAIEEFKELDGQMFCPWCLDLELANR